MMNRRRPGWILAQAVLICGLHCWPVVLGPVPAYAQGVPASQEALGHARRGLHEYQSQEPRAALDSFLAAYSVKPVPGLLRDIARCYEALGAISEALLYYRRYLRSSAHAADRVQVQKRVASLTEQSRSRLPVPEAVVTSGLEYAAWTTFGLAAVAIGGGAVVSWSVAQRANELSRRERFAPDEYERLKSLARLQAWFYGAGAAAAVTGALLLFLGRERTETSSVLALGGSAASGELWMRLRF